jgi:hypothetical protein
MEGQLLEKDLHKKLTQKGAVVLLPLLVCLAVVL